MGVKPKAGSVGSGALRSNFRWSTKVCDPKVPSAELTYKTREMSQVALSFFSDLNL